MIVSYDRFTEAFLAKITEYNFLRLTEQNRQEILFHQFFLIHYIHPNSIN